MSRFFCEQIRIALVLDQRSTGPHTEEGKSASARKTGLFAARDFIRPEEQNEYEELSESLEAELNPEGALENQIAGEIRTAIWRLRHCAQVEADLTGEHDPMDPASPQAKQQPSIDRARNQATRRLHKNTAELRPLQTERHYRNEIAADGIDTEGLSLLCDFHAASSRADRAVKSNQRHQFDKLKTELDTMELQGRYNAHQAGAAVAETEFTKRTPPTEPPAPRAPKSPGTPHAPAAPAKNTNAAAENRPRRSSVSRNK